jgi:hypothetical protein
MFHYYDYLVSLQLEWMLEFPLGCVEHCFQWRSLKQYHWPFCTGTSIGASSVGASIGVSSSASRLRPRNAACSGHCSDCRLLSVPAMAIKEEGEKNRKTRCLFAKQYDANEMSNHLLPPFKIDCKSREC